MLKHLGIASIRLFNSTRLRELDQPVVIYDHSEPIAAMVPYALYLRWQKEIETMADRKAPTPPPTNQVKPDPPPAPPAKREMGGSAFPYQLSNEQFTYAGQVSKGMTLRDYFASQALVGVLQLRAVSQLRGLDEESSFQEDIADECWQLADALLARRHVNQDEPGQPDRYMCHRGIDHNHATEVEASACMRGEK